MTIGRAPHNRPYHSGGNRINPPLYDKVCPRCGHKTTFAFMFMAQRDICENCLWDITETGNEEKSKK